MADLDGFFAGLVLLFFLFLLVLVILIRGSQRNEDWASHPITWNIFICILILYSFFFVTEVHYRFFADATDSFAINRITERWLQRHYQLNNFGTRDNLDYEPRIRAGKRRLTIVGDSFTAGHGVKDINQRFGNLLRRQLSHWEVHVMARNGHETDDILPRIRGLHHQGYEFDVVLLAYNLNDIAYLVDDREAIYDEIERIKTSQNYFVHNSYFLNTLWTRWSMQSDPRIANYYHFVRAAYQSEAWVTHMDSLKTLHDDLRSMTNEFMVATIPFFSDLSETYFFKSVHTQLDSFWNSMQVPHLDLGPTFYHQHEQDLMVNKFDPHPNEDAHLLIFQKISDFLQSNVSTTVNQKEDL